MDKNKIKVCYLIGSMKIGGAEHHIVKLLKHTDRKKIDPVLALFIKEGDLLSDAMMLDVPIYEVGLKKLYGFNAVKCVWTFGRFLVKENVDVVHAFVWQANFFGSITAKLCMKKSVISKRNMNIWMGTTHILLNKISNILADKISVVSAIVRESVLEKEKPPTNKLVVVPNGVDILKPIDAQEIARLKKQFSVNDKNILIGVVASLVSRKGHSYLIKAAEIIKKTSPNFCFLLLGDGVLRKELEKQVEQLGVKEQVSFLGYRDDVGKIMDIIDIFSLASLEEGMSNALMEAMAHGVPPVVTNVGGNSENINNRENGILVEPCNPKEMANALLLLIGSRKMRTSMGKEARSTMKREFSMAKVVQKNLEIYKDLVVKGNN